MSWNSNRQYSWRDGQIKAIKLKVCRAASLLKYAKKFLNNGILCKMCRGLAEPHFSFCSLIWGCSGETKIKSIQKLQKRAARIVASKPSDYSVTSMLKELGWPSVIIFKKGSIMRFKVLRYDLGPSYLLDLFQNLTQVQKRELRNKQTDL